jgi:hypothetical protein
MKNCEFCKVEIAENKTYCSTACKQKAYRKRSKIKVIELATIPETQLEYSPQYIEQIKLVRQSESNVIKIQSEITAIEIEINQIETRNYTIFGKKSMIISAYGFSIVLAYISFKIADILSEKKNKGWVFAACLGPFLAIAHFGGNYFQKNEDLYYLEAVKSLKPLKIRKSELESQLLMAKQAYLIEKTELDYLPKFILEKESISKNNTANYN